MTPTRTPAWRPGGRLNHLPIRTKASQQSDDESICSDAEQPGEFLFEGRLADLSSLHALVERAAGWIGRDELPEAAARKPKALTVVVDRPEEVGRERRSPAGGRCSRQVPSSWITQSMDGLA
jgi:hypothetical protein